MRLVVRTILAGSESFGSPGLAYLKWENPVRPGDVCAARRSASSAASRRASRRSASCAGAGACATSTTGAVLDLEATSLFDLAADRLRLERERARVDDVARDAGHRRDDPRGPRRRQLRRAAPQASARHPPTSASGACRRFRRRVDDQHEFAALAVRRRRRARPAPRRAACARSSRTSW